MAYAYLDDDDFSIVSQNDIISVFGDILGALTIFLGAIAGISLLVGGIGIMNIMLVSVTERTREIGLRKAVGAKRRDVLIQFLIEAVTLAVLGGLIGITLGVVGANGISAAFDAFEAVVGVDAILLSLFFSMAVGALSSASIRPTGPAGSIPLTRYAMNRFAAGALLLGMLILGACGGPNQATPTAIPAAVVRPAQPAAALCRRRTVVSSARAVSDRVRPRQGAAGAGRGAGDAPLLSHRLWSRPWPMPRLLRASRRWVL